VQWSGDGKLLAALVDAGAGHTQLAVLDPSSGASRQLGRATDARWRGSDLLYWDFTAPGPINLYDAARGAVADPVYAAADGVIVDRAELRPRSTDLAVREHTSSSLPHVIVYEGNTGASTIKISDAQWVLGFWWSSDATRLYVWTFDNGTTTVSDVLTNTLAVTFCFRLTVEPPCSMR
jgi:hypothetical protein